MPITADRDKVRLRVGDTDSADPLLYDDEIDYFLADNTTVTTAGTAASITGAAADAAAAIAAKFSRGYNFSTDGQSFNRSERVNHYTQLAVQLRKEASAGGVTVPIGSSVAAAVGDGLILGE